MNDYTLKKKTALILITIFISFFISLLLGESYIRLFAEYSTPETVREKSLQFESSLFARNVFPQKEQNVEHNKVNIFINNKGYRGNNFTVGKSEGLIRIIIFGGSAVFDPKVPGEKHWPHRIENILKDKDVKNV